MSEHEERMKKLPVWARDYILRLETRVAELQGGRELNQAKFRVKYLEQQNKLYKNRIDAMTDLVTCAARGGHETAKEFVDRVIAEWLTEEPNDE